MSWRSPQGCKREQWGWSNVLVSVISLLTLSFIDRIHINSQYA
jgi:hypothetical protein